MHIIPFFPWPMLHLHVLPSPLLLCLLSFHPCDTFRKCVICTTPVAMKLHHTSTQTNRMVHAEYTKSMYHLFLCITLYSFRLPSNQVPVSYEACLCFFLLLLLVQLKISTLFVCKITDVTVICLVTMMMMNYQRDFLLLLSLSPLVLPAPSLLTSASLWQLSLSLFVATHS